MEEKLALTVNLLPVWKRREADLGRRIRYQEAVKETGLSTATLVAWRKGRVTRFDAATLISLCVFFQCRPGDLLGLA